MTDFVNIKVVTTDKEYYDAMYVRRTVFVDEQNIRASLEFDGNDFNATHLIAYYDENPVGTIRLRYFKDFVKLERLCVVAKMRKTNISRLIIQSALSFAAQKGFEHAHAICKKELLKTWQRDGFDLIHGAEPVTQNGMTLLPISCKIPKVKNCITLETSPAILNMKEGEWFAESKIEQTAELKHKEQKQNFENLKSIVQNLRIAENISPKNFRIPLRYDFLDEAGNKTY